jgi:SPP1 family holin
MKITKSTIVRTILVALVLVNFILERNGIDVIPTDENTVTMFVETAMEVAVILVAWWKNNSFSPAAIRADKFLKELKESE